MDLIVKPDPNRKKGPEETPAPVQPSSMATIHDDDELLLARIGYKQVHLPNASFHDHNGVQSDNSSR
jgi:hypothetical protein